MKSLLLFGSLASVGFCGKDKHFYCEVCRALVEESHYKVSQVDPKKTIDTGSGRVDPNGQMKEKKKQWRLSESHLTEVFETVCKSIADDYVVEKDPDTAKLYVKRMLTFEGAMNTDVNFQNIMKDKEDDPSKPPREDVMKIRWTCENILEEVEEDLIDAFQTLAEPDEDDQYDEERMVEFICEETDICPTGHDEL